MPIQHLIKRYPMPGKKHEMPVLFHEPHVETGFRHINQPWYYYLLSLFQWHNESMNAWTHLVGCLIALCRIYTIANEFNAYSDPWLYPMLAGSITMIIMYFCSFAAHTFHNKSELWHYTCFFIDYCGIGLFGLGSSIIHYFYCTHPALAEMKIYKYAIPIATILSVVVTVFCSHSKAKYSRPYPFTRKIWQLSSVIAIYCWLILPIVHRMYMYYYSEKRQEKKWDQSLEDHTTQMAWFLAAGFFFGSDIPQRVFPGKFDCLFHSHQIFHVCITFMNLKQIDAIYVDIHSHLERIKTFEEVPTLWNTFGAVLLVIVIDIGLVLIFRERAKARILREAAEKHGWGFICSSLATLHKHCFESLTLICLVRLFILNVKMASWTPKTEMLK